MARFGEPAAKQAAPETVQVEIARQQPSQLVETRHGQVTGLPIAVPAADQGKWLVAHMPDSVVQALLARTAELPESQRQSFINDWMTRNQDAMYDAYQQFAEAGGGGRRFTYSIVPVESVQVAPPVVHGPFGIIIPRPAIPAPIVAATETAPTQLPSVALRPGRLVGGTPQPVIDEETGHVFVSFNVMSSAGSPVAVMVDMDSDLGIIDHSTYPTPADRSRFLANSLQGALSRSAMAFFGILSGSRDKVAVTIGDSPSDLDSLRRLFETGSAEEPVATTPVPAPAGEAVAAPVETRALSVRFTERGDGSEEHPYVIDRGWERPTPLRHSFFRCHILQSHSS